MSEELLNRFSQDILANLEKNGYPANRVALPLEKMYEVAHNKGLNFNKALELLGNKGVAHEKTTEKVIFYPKEENALPSLDKMKEMAKHAEEMMKNMSPEDLKKVQDMVANMSESERQEMLSQAKNLGLWGR